MNNKEMLSHVDHTLLQTDAAWEQIRKICDEAVKYGVASVCIPPSYVSQVKEYLRGQIPVCTVIGFPNGYNTTAVKVYEAKDAVTQGADEVDMVVNIGWVKDRLYDRVREEIAAVKQAVGDIVVKVIIETCLLTKEEKITLCGLVNEAGADYIKTSTGFSKGGATREDVRLMVEKAGPKVKVKAAGGIGSLQDARDFLDIGADRLGTSRIVKLLENQQTDGY